MQPCLDNYATTFASYDDMQRYHEDLSKESQWRRYRVNELHIEPLDRGSPLYANPYAFATGVSEESVKDTAENLGLAVSLAGNLYPLRDTAYTGLLDRAKIKGSALAKLSRTHLAEVLNHCLAIHSADALVLLRDEKVSATLSGSEEDYSILPIDELLRSLEEKLTTRFPGNIFERGYCDHSFSSAEWTLPGQKEDLLGCYTKTLDACGKAHLSKRLMPAVRFVTSDTGVASAKVSALLLGLSAPIHIGGCVAVKHKNYAKLEDFSNALDQLFAQFSDRVAQLQHLLDVQLDYPINAMTRVCKALALPKKAAVEAIAMFEMANANAPATAHDVFFALQEIPFILRSQHISESKLLLVEENLARALTLRWEDYDLAKAVSY